METYLVLLRVEFTLLCTVTRHTVRSYRTLSPLPAAAETTAGGLLSAALVVGLTRPGVTWHPTLWSPDFPPPYNKYKAAIVWPTSDEHCTLLVTPTLANHAKIYSADAFAFVISPALIIVKSSTDIYFLMTLWTCSAVSAVIRAS